MSTLEIEDLEIDNQECSRHSLDCVKGRMYFDSKTGVCQECPQKTRPDSNRRTCIWDKCDDVQYLDDDGFCKLPLCTKEIREDHLSSLLLTETFESSPRGSDRIPLPRCYESCPKGFRVGGDQKACIDEIY